MVAIKSHIRRLWVQDTRCDDVLSACADAHTETAAMNNTQTLIARIKSFDETQSFDAYPSMTATDEVLIHEAFEENRKHNDCTDCTQFLVFLITQCVQTSEEARNARRYFNAHVETLWAANVIESCTDFESELLS